MFTAGDGLLCLLSSQLSEILAGMLYGVKSNNSPGQNFLYYSEPKKFIFICEEKSKTEMKQWCLNKQQIGACYQINQICRSLLSGPAWMNAPCFCFWQFLVVKESFMMQI